MASSSVRNHPNFAVICSFLQRYGEHLRLPDLTIPELEEVLEETNAVGHGLKELIITLMRRIVNSIKPDRWEKHLIKLIDNYHSPVDAWELESLGFSLCKLETKLSILKYLCETQFDDNPKFKNIVNKETPEEQKIKPIGRDKLGLVYWFQKDHDCNIRIYREEQDDIDETSWQTVGRGRDDLANLIAELKVAYGAKLPLDSLESSRSATPILTNGEANAVKPESGNGTNSTTKEGTGVVNDADVCGAKDDIKSEDCTKNREVKTEGERGEEIKKERCENTEDWETREEKPILSEGLDVKSEFKKEEEDGKETVTSQVHCEKEGALNLQEEQKTGAKLISTTEDKALKTEGNEEGTVGSVVKEENDADERLETADSESEKQKLEKESSLLDLKTSGNEKGEIVNENSQRDENVPVEKAGVKVDGKLAVHTGDNEGEKKQNAIEGDTEKGKGCVKEQFALEEKESERSSETIAEKSADRIETHDENNGANEQGGVGGDGGEVTKDSRSEQKENGDTSVTLQTQDEIKKLSKEEKCATQKAKETQATEESPEMGWSRRRLRVRKPPPKKEEEVVVQKKPKKKVKEGNKTARSGDEVVKKREKKKKKVETESEEEIEEQEEESEEIEEDNTSDEDFILGKEQTKSSSADTAPPVVKARTAKSKKKSKASSKRVEPEELSDEPCIKCGNYNHPDQILLCDSCDAGYHTACLRPPLMYVPDGQWFCPACEHLALLKNLEATLEVVDSELKVIRQKNRKKQDKYKWLLTEVCSANILPEDSSVLITKRIERVEKPERPRHERTRPMPRKVSRAFIEEPDEIEYIQRRSGRNRKQISYKFEEFDTAINTAIHDEVEEKRKAKAQEEQTGFGRSRGKDMSTIEAAKWEEEEEEHASRKKKKKLNDLDATSEEEDDDSDEFKVNNESCSDEDFIADGDEESQDTEEDEEELVMSSMSDSGSEYGSRRKRGSQKKKKVRSRRRDLGPVRRSSRNLGRERKVYQDSTSSESEEDRPRDAWRMNPIITARRQRESDAEFSEKHRERKRKRRQSSSQDSEDGSEDEGKHRKKSAPSTIPKEGSKKRKKKKDKKVSSSSEEDEDEGYVQPKRKFRIDSDDSNGSDEDQADDSQDKGWRAGSEDEEDRTKRKLTVRNTLRGMCSKRVDYRKMAEGSSSEEEDKIQEGEGDEGDRRDDFESEVKHEGKNSGVKDDHRITGNVGEGERVDGTSLLTGNVNQNNSVAADDDSLSQISDLEDLKENGSFSSEKVQTISGDKIDKRSTEDDDDLEGVTDIFDYLSKD
ncbi:Remodeling and spacing factor 1 [Holothuria leucospilota]|uniref:Remodeling and spacing factor 1 n=1 Tax=Holothuria leucospilota TaxID=206669 RepID=A0A9Q1BRE7_HOLLE|nr:Remodeling and spacing factor 1 [Holothuria leucospilota]